MAGTVPPEYRMANDIAANVQHLPEDRAAEALAEHIRRFWDPRMRALLIAQVEQAGPECHPTVAAAAGLLPRPG